VMNEQAKIGFVYQLELIKDGVVVDAWQDTNVIPLEGIHHMFNGLMLGGAQVTQWYIGLYENNYTPSSSDEMATFPTLAGETTVYENASRHAFAAATPTGGVISNAGTPAEVAFTATRTIRGGFIASAALKGSTAGVLLSAVRFSSPRQVDAGSILRVTAGLQLISN